MTYRLPPNQQLAAPGKWPVVGEQAPGPGGPWRVSVGGLVAAPRSWSLEELPQLASVERTVDVHCVTRWSKPGMHFGGVPLAALLADCGPLPEARFARFVARSERGHSTSLPLADALALETLVALTCEGAPLAGEHGGPVRTVVPGRYFYKSLKWLERVELLAEDRLGYWEAEAGYHNRADPWREERYLAPDLDRRAARQLLASRDFGGRDLRGLAAAGRELRCLDARAALLRDAHFEDADLAGACFAGANLSNAHFQGADLRGASFAGADVEGADFRGADLRRADFTGASLSGATFGPEPGAGAGARNSPARVDMTTRIEPAAIEWLTPAQAAFVRACLGPS